MLFLIRIVPLLKKVFKNPTLSKEVTKYPHIEILISDIIFALYQQEEERSDIKLEFLRVFDY
jgi:hypothetical protein